MWLVVHEEARTEENGVSSAGDFMEGGGKVRDWTAKKESCKPSRKSE